MIINNFQVHNTLRAYGQQLAEKTRLTKVKVPPKNGPKDEVVLSPESKKRLMAEKISHQLIQQFNNGSELGSTHREVLSRLSQEFGQPVKVEKKEGQGMVFKILDGKSSEGGRSASPEESEKIERKLFEITQSIVYNNIG
jgi:hypothetical protein